MVSDRASSGWRSLPDLMRNVEPAKRHTLALAVGALAGEALAELHRQGRTHGGLSAERVAISRNRVELRGSASKSTRGEAEVRRDALALAALLEEISALDGSTHEVVSALVALVRQGQAGAAQIAKTCRVALDAERLDPLTVLARSSSPRGEKAAAPQLGNLFDLGLIAGAEAEVTPMELTPIKTKLAEPDRSPSVSGSMPWFTATPDSSADTNSVSADKPEGSTSGDSLPDFGTAVDPARLIGSELGGYRIESLISEGASSLVFRGRDPRTGLMVAVKVLRAALERTSTARRRLEREAAALQKLDHAHLVGIRALGDTPQGHAFAVMELVQGRTLEAMLREEAPLDPTRAAEIMGQIAEGLAAAHAAGVIHRDLKPANVMVLRSGDREQIKILDFGLTRIVDSDETRLTRAAQLLGTPRYMAPEQILDPSASGPQADLYALGVVGYRLVTGELPFKATAIPEVLRQHQEEPPPPLPDLDGLGPVIEQLLAKAPGDRPTAVVLVDLLAPLRPHPSVEVMVVPASRSRLPLAAMIAALLATVAVSALAAMMLSNSTTPGTVPPLRRERVEIPAAAVATPTIAAVPAEPTPPPVTTIEPPPPKPAAAMKRKDRAAAASKAPRIVERSPPPAPAEDPVRALTAQLRKSGLRAGDVELLLGDSATASRWRKGERDPGTAKALLDELTQTPINADFLGRKLGRLLNEMRATALSMERARAFEERYFELRKRVAEAGAAELLPILSDIHTLEDEVRREKAGPGEVDR